MNEQMMDKYKIIEEIGKGGFATVYRAVDTTLNRKVALKVLDPLLMRDEAFVARFQQEARAAASLEHPHIVPIYEVGEGDGRLFIAMRLVRGPSLAQRLETQGRFPWEDTLDILRQVSDALAYAHEEGVVHRDIKPHNILLDERSGPMLSDFGFARLVGTSTLTQSLSGGIVGTPAYIAPEIWEGVKATPATDVYALACVVYEMLTGEVLFGGETPMVVMRAHDRGAQLPEEWPIDVPPDVGRVLARALARQPDERYATVPEFLGALEELQTAAVAERIAAEVARLAGQMRQALDAGQFEAAVAAGERLLELEPDHSEGARLLGEAHAKLAKQRELAKRLEGEQTSLEEEQRELAAEKAKLAERRAELEAEEERLAAERAEVEHRLEELRETLADCEKDKGDIRDQLQALEKRMEELDQQTERLSQATTLLEEGKLEQLERLFAQPTGPSPTPKEQSTWIYGRPTSLDSKSAKPERQVPAKSEQQVRDQAIQYGIIAVLTLLVGLVFVNEVPGFGVFLIVVGIVLGLVALSKAIAH